MPRKGQRAVENHPWREAAIRAAVRSGARGQARGVAAGIRTGREKILLACPYCGVPNAIPHADDCPAR